MTKALQAVDAVADQGQRVDDVADRPYQFPTIPHVCLIADVCRILRISERQFHYLMARKALALVELARVDRVRRFTGESVARQIKSWAGRAPMHRAS